MGSGLDGDTRTLLAGTLPIINRGPRSWAPSNPLSTHIQHGPIPLLFIANYTLPLLKGESDPDPLGLQGQGRNALRLEIDASSKAGV